MAYVAALKRFSVLKPTSHNKQAKLNVGEEKSVWEKRKAGCAATVFVLCVLVFSGCGGEPVPESISSESVAEPLVEQSGVELTQSQDLDAAYEVLPDDSFVMTRSYLPADAKETDGVAERAVSGSWDTDIFPREILEQATDFSLLECNLAMGGRYSEQDLDMIIRRSRTSGPVVPASEQLAEGSDPFHSDFSYRYTVPANKASSSLTMLWGVWGKNNALLAVCYMDVPKPVAE